MEGRAEKTPHGWIYKSTIDLISRLAVDLPRAMRLVQSGTLAASTAEAGLFDNSSILAAAEKEHLEKVWVFSPHPLESLPDHMHVDLRTQVIKNLLAGVKYVYFVESDSGVARITQLVERLAKAAPVAYHEAIERIRRAVTICVLDSASFLTHFVVHFARDGRIDVYQAVVLQDRNDLQTKLDSARALEVQAKIAALMENTVEFAHQGIVVRKKIA